MNNPDHIVNSIESHEIDLNKVNKALVMLEEIRQKEQDSLDNLEISDKEWIELWED